VVRVTRISLTTTLRMMRMSKESKACSIDGCDIKYYSRDLCKKHYMKHYRKHFNTPKEERASLRDYEITDYNDFWQFVKKELGITAKDYYA
jgi:hypothetical protein